MSNIKFEKRAGITVEWDKINQELVVHKDSPAKKAWKTRLENKRKKMQDDNLIPRTIDEEIHNAIKDALKMLRR